MLSSVYIVGTVIVDANNVYRTAKIDVRLNNLTIPYSGIPIFFNLFDFLCTVKLTADNLRHYNIIIVGNSV